MIKSKGNKNPYRFSFPISCFGACGTGEGQDDPRVKDLGQPDPLFTRQAPISAKSSHGSPVRGPRGTQGGNPET